jgi:hypothetical protein
MVHHAPQQPKILLLSGMCVLDKIILSSLPTHEETQKCSHAGTEEEASMCLLWLQMGLWALRVRRPGRPYWIGIYINILLIYTSTVIFVLFPKTSRPPELLGKLVIPFQKRETNGRSGAETLYLYHKIQLFVPSSVTLQVTFRFGHFSSY